MLFSLAGCEPQIVLDLPSADTIVAIEISDGYVQKQEHTLKSSQVIFQVMRLVQRNNSGWSVPFGTFPTPKASAAFKNRNGTIDFVLWFGPDWVGARSFSGQRTDSYIWAVGIDVREQLERILGVGA